MKKAPVLLHPEQESAQKKPWERMEGEPAHYFMLFKSYVMMGRDRSLQAIAEQDRLSKKAIKGQENESVQPAEDTSTPDAPIKKKKAIPGALKRAAVQWRWRERAAASDNDVRLEIHKEVLLHLDHEAEYITKAQRLDALNMLMKNLMRIMLETNVVDANYKNWLAMHRQMLATLREIRREMKEFDTLSGVSLFDIAHLEVPL